MNKTSLVRNAALCQAVAVLLLGISPEVNSQPRQDSMLDRVRRLEQKHQLLLQQQAKTLEVLAEMQKDANQLRIFSKRN